MIIFISPIHNGYHGAVALMGADHTRIGRNSMGHLQAKG